MTALSSNASIFHFIDPLHLLHFCCYFCHNLFICVRADTFARGPIDLSSDSLSVRTKTSTRVYHRNLEIDIFIDPVLSRTFVQNLHHVSIIWSDPG